jgi:hypothetical protein
LEKQFGIGKIIELDMEFKGCPSFTIFSLFFFDYLGLNLFLKFFFAIWLDIGILGKLDV